MTKQTNEQFAATVRRAMQTSGWHRSQLLEARAKLWRTQADLQMLRRDGYCDRDFVVRLAIQKFYNALDQVWAMQCLLEPKL